MKIFEKIKKNNIIILFFLTLIFMTIGFATYNQILNVSGSVSLVPGGTIEITSVRIASLTNAKADPQIINNNTGIEFNLSFTTVQAENPVYQAVFDVTISNQTFEDFVFSMPSYELTVDKVTNAGVERKDEYSEFVGLKINNAEIGDKIPAKSKKSFQVVITFANPEDSYNVTYLINSNFVPNVNKDADAILMASVVDSEPGNLRGNNINAKFAVKVINTHSTERTFTIGVKNTNKFKVDNTQIMQYTIDANSEGEFDFYITKEEEVEFPYNSTNIDIIIESQGTRYNAGSVTVLVDQTILINDTTPPTISNVIATIGETEGTVALAWDAIDNVKIDNYIIYVYRKNGTRYERVDEINTQSTNKSMLISELEEGTYYFTICGIDNSNNTATAEQIEGATIAPGEASRCEDIDLIWNFTVTINATNLTYTGESTVKRGETYVVTFAVNNTNYRLPNSLTSITMGRC